MSIANLAANTASYSKPTVHLRIPGRELEQTENNGGGVSFIVDPWSALDRFLVTGVEGGTYYNNERNLTIDSCKVAKSLIDQNGTRVVNRTVEISQAGRAKKNDYAVLIMALAISFGNDATKRLAATSLPLVARTFTDLSHFITLVKNLRGFGKLLKFAIQNWYSSKTPDQVAYQALKYQTRDGWSQRDVLRVAHPNAGEDVVRNDTYNYIVKGYDESKGYPSIIHAYERAKTVDRKTLVNMIIDNRLSHEMIPNDMKKYPAIWEALSQHMGTTALLRNINKMSSIGLLVEGSEFSKNLATKLNDVTKLKKDRIHPMTVLVAQRQYAMGRGDKGSLLWVPDKNIVSALEGTFYGSFQAVEPTGKNIMQSIDISPSMDHSVLGLPVSCREASTVMAMVTARCEKNSVIFGFASQFRQLGITANDTLAEAMKKAFSDRFSGTDMSLPYKLAMAEGWDIDAFNTYTDNEVNTGTHPSQALNEYRRKMNKPNCKQIIIAGQLNNFTIADPKDRNSLDIAGFDSAVPALISEFIMGRM